MRVHLQLQRQVELLKVKNESVVFVITRLNTANWVLLRLIRVTKIKYKNIEGGPR